MYQYNTPGIDLSGWPVVAEVGSGDLRRKKRPAFAVRRPVSPSKGGTDLDPGVPQPPDLESVNGRTGLPDAKSTAPAAGSARPPEPRRHTRVSDHDRLREYIGGLERPCLLRRHGNSTASAIPGRVSWRRSRSAKPDQAPGITRMSGHRRSDSSAVTRMSSCTTAVAAMKRSAGSS